MCFILSRPLSICDQSPCQQSDWAECQDCCNSSSDRSVADTKLDEALPEFAIERKIPLWEAWLVNGPLLVWIALKL